MMLHWMGTSHVVYPFIGRWTFGLFSHLGTVTICVPVFVLRPSAQMFLILWAHRGAGSLGQVVTLCLNSSGTVFPGATASGWGGSGDSCEPRAALWGGIGVGLSELMALSPLTPKSTEVRALLWLILGKPRPCPGGKGMFTPFYN